MNYNQLLEELSKLQDNNSEESNKKIIELIDNYTNSLSGLTISSEIVESKGNNGFNDIIKIANDSKNVADTKDNKKTLKAIRQRAVINLLEIELNNLSLDQKKEKIYLQGKLIKEYKKLEKYEVIDKEKYNARYKKVELMESQKELMKDYRQTAEDISLSDKVSLNIREIANTINSFVIKKDIIYKIKNVFKDSTIAGVSSAALIVGIGMAVQLATGLPIGFAGLSSVLPLIGYSALTSTMSNFSTKTSFEQYEYFQSEEFKKYLKEFQEDNKELLSEYKSLINEKQSCFTNEEKVMINEELIKKLDEICKKIKVKGFRDTYALQALILYRENKKYCKEIIDEYLDEKNNDTEKYRKYNSKLGKINLEIFSRENSLKEALKASGKNVVKNTAIMALAKAVVTAVVPEASIAVHGLNSFILPVAIAITNGLIEIPTYNGKLKYKEVSENKKVDVEEENNIRKLFSNYEHQLNAA